MGCGSSTSYRRNSIISKSEVNDIQPLNSKKNNIVITSEALQNYLDLEHAIREQEKKHVLENYQIKTEQLEQLEKSLSQLQELVANCNQEIMVYQHKFENHNDPKSVKEFILRKSYTNEDLTNEEENFLDALNKQEIVEKELNNTIEAIENIKIEIERLSKEGEKIQELYAKRDELLDSIFEGQYGSDLEIQIEHELDILLEQKHHVDQAYFRWKQAQIHTKQASNQMAYAIQKWKEITEIPLDDNEKRYELASDARNNLLEASGNLANAQRYLLNITFPYCNPEELETLDKAISFIFTDMQTPERHEHALICYQTTHKRAAALKQWLDHVLNTTIARDLHEISEESRTRAAELRNERTRLIRNKIKEMTGSEGLNGANHELRDSGVDSEFDDASTVDEQIARLFDSSRNERKGATSLTPDPTKMPLIYPTPLPTVDLAPLPKKEEIFGKIEFLRNKYKRDISEFQKTQKMNQVRVAQGLKEKLQARRSRRCRMQMHNRELEALRETP